MSHAGENYVRLLGANESDKWEPCLTDTPNIEAPKTAPTAPDPSSGTDRQIAADTVPAPVWTSRRSFLPGRNR